MEKDPGRVAAVEKIKEFERLGLFDKDVEIDPPWTPLNPDKIDFLKKNLFNKLKSHIATFCGWRFFEKSLKKKVWIFKGVTGLENLTGFEGGALITCNHISRYDNYAVHKAMRQHFGHYRLHKVVREGNYSFPGLIGFLLRNGDTIPVGDGHRFMVKFADALKGLLKKNTKILIYPEQGMWWNYRKPRPLKKGAFLFAAKLNAPIIPCFITLNDSEYIGADGFPVQEYTVNILPIIRPDAGLDASENCKKMLERNFELWKDCFEKTYGIELNYCE